ncbi:hypothetical protein FH972_006027 [Carpinus fangiana]|uniref:Uncharacterized protein n=1 Tax=Carpinus fangiana TaxID=176857 RepID=A0A5N6QUA4_9ROSI|nr:hypothetical protein FH972_006027 [Carpinus fangiana]
MGPGGPGGGGPGGGGPGGGGPGGWGASTAYAAVGCCKIASADHAAHMALLAADLHLSDSLILLHFYGAHTRPWTFMAAIIGPPKVLATARLQNFRVATVRSVGSSR